MSGLQKAGLTLVALAFLIPTLTYVGCQYFLMQDAAAGGPPNQGAMFTAGLTYVGAIAIGILLMLIGLCLLIAGTVLSRKRPPQSLAQ